MLIRKNSLNLFVQYNHQLQENNWVINPLIIIIIEEYKTVLLVEVFQREWPYNWKLFCHVWMTLSLLGCLMLLVPEAKMSKWSKSIKLSHCKKWSEIAGSFYTFLTRFSF